jgi:hypothetical protein
MCATTRTRRAKPLDLNATKDVRSFAGPWRRDHKWGPETFRIADVHDKPGRHAVFIITNGYDRDRGEYPPLSDEQRRRGRLMLVAPQMYAALKLVRQQGGATPELAHAIGQLLDTIGN